MNLNPREGHRKYLECAKPTGHAGNALITTELAIRGDEGGHGAVTKVGMGGGGDTCLPLRALGGWGHSPQGGLGAGAL